MHKGCKMKREIREAIKTAVRFELESGIDRDQVKDAIIDELTDAGTPHDIDEIVDAIDTLFERLVKHLN